MNKIFILLVIFLFSCNRNEKSLNITSVLKQQTDTLFLKKNYHYTSYRIRISGYTNDSILVNDFYLKGKIDTLIRKDFYGNNENYIVLYYKPFRASKGNLLIKHYAN